MCSSLCIQNELFFVHTRTCCNLVSVKLLRQKQARYAENKMKALKARNEYLLAIDGANAAVQKYFVEDLPLLIEVGISHSYRS